MPGYLEGSVPHGVSFFAPDENQQQLLQQLAGDHPLDLSSAVKGELPITGIYSMGSTSSVGQNSVSDLDIWVCHQSWLDNEERLNLQRKCTLLQKWCVSLGVEVSFFLIDETASAIMRAAASAVRTAVLPNIFYCWMSSTVPPCAWRETHSVEHGAAKKNIITTIT